jgi:hypothetical protein
MNNKYTFSIACQCSACGFHGAQDDCEVCAGEVNYSRLVIVPIDVLQAIQTEVSKTLIPTLKESAEFIDRHSEDWYQPGQSLLKKCRDVIGLHEQIESPQDASQDLNSDEQKEV